jgi:hypothetical protein
VAIDSFVLVVVQKTDNTQKFNYGAQFFLPSPVSSRSLKAAGSPGVAIRTISDQHSPLTFAFLSVLPLPTTTTTTTRMSSSRSGSPASPSPRLGTPYSENDIDQTMSSASQSNPSSPIPSDVADCPTSNSSGSGSHCSRAPTPQCLPLDDIDNITPDNVSSPNNGPDQRPSMGC